MINVGFWSTDAWAWNGSLSTHVVFLAPQFGDGGRLGRLIFCRNWQNATTRWRPLFGSGSLDGV
jgi:hypothetical protein